MHRKHQAPFHGGRRRSPMARSALVLAICAAIVVPGSTFAAGPIGATSAGVAVAAVDVALLLDGELRQVGPVPALAADAPAASLESTPTAAAASPTPTAVVSAASPAPSTSVSLSSGSAGGQIGSRSAIPTPGPTPTPMLTITPPPRPATLDARVPSTVTANLGAFASEMPAPYYDGCHVSMGGTISSRSCLYGNLASHTTIAIYGDSHALAWFPAVLRAAQAHGWRVLDVTMSACIPADLVQVTASGSVMTACTAFRKAAIAKLAKYHPTVILVTGTRGFRAIDSSGRLLTGAARTSAWTSGMKRTLAKLIPIAGRVAMIADTPNSRFSNPIGCTATHLGSILACATAVTRAINYSWLNTEYHAALAKHVAFIDAERWVCRSSPCPLVVGGLITHRNAGHLTVRFARSMYARMANALVAIMAEPGKVIGP